MNWLELIRELVQLLHRSTAVSKLAVLYVLRMHVTRILEIPVLSEAQFKAQTVYSHIKQETAANTHSVKTETRTWPGFRGNKTI